MVIISDLLGFTLHAYGTWAQSKLTVKTFTHKQMAEGTHLERGRNNYSDYGYLLKKKKVWDLFLVSLNVVDNEMTVADDI